MDNAQQKPVAQLVGGLPAMPTSKFPAIGRLYAPLTPEQRKAS